MNTWSKEINLDDYAECKEFRIHYYTRRMNGGYNSHLFLVNWGFRRAIIKGMESDRFFCSCKYSKPNRIAY